MSLQDKINKHLQNEIDREVMIKNARDKVEAEYIETQNSARHKIEDLKELKRLEDEYLLDFE